MILAFQLCYGEKINLKKISASGTNDIAQADFREQALNSIISHYASRLIKTGLRNR